MSARLELVALPDFPRIRPGDDLADAILASLRAAELRLRSGDILVVAQKIVSKAENRYVALADVTPRPEALALARAVDKDPRIVELVLQESLEVLRHRPGVLVVAHRLGFVLANAGIDSSNVDPAGAEERVLLLPADPDASCRSIRAKLTAATGIDVAVIINDSLGRAWRNGTVGTALGVSGLPALLDMRGRPDLNGRVLRATEVGVADEVAAAASLLMGQSDEGRPVVLVRGFPHPLREGSGQELIRPRHLDLFR